MGEWLTFIKRWRTVALGIIAFIALIYGAIVVFEVKTEVMLQILLSSVLLAVAMIFLALIATLIRFLLKKIWQRFN
jgi:ACR3 family arsenite efflux pump ArsB